MSQYRDLKVQYEALKVEGDKLRAQAKASGLDIFIETPLRPIPPFSLVPGARSAA